MLWHQHKFLTATGFGLAKRQLSFATFKLFNGRKDKIDEGKVGETIGATTEDEYFYKKSREELEKIKDDKPQKHTTPPKEDQK